MSTAAVGPSHGGEVTRVGDCVVRGVEAGELVVRVGGLATGEVTTGAPTLFQDVGVAGGRQAAFVVGEPGPALPEAAVPIEASDVDRLEHTGTATTNKIKHVSYIQSNSTSSIIIFLKI